MKHLPKHVRQRWRYIAVELETWPDATFDRRDFQRHCWFGAQNLLGDTGSASVDLSVMDFERTDGRGRAIVRTRRESVTQARAVLSTISEVGDDPVGIRIRGISGTIRACEEKYLGDPPESTSQSDVVFAGARRPAVRRDGCLDVATEEAFVGATQLDIP